MLILRGTDLQKYKALNIKEDWKERDFVKYVRDYFSSKTHKVLFISGLRGVGKSTGLLQATNKLDALYILAQDSISNSFEECKNILLNCSEKYIVIDEYSWIEKYEELAGLLFSLVQNGKRIVITGTETAVIERVKFGKLIHRIEIKHVTYFSYSEFCTLNNMPFSLASCEKYLEIGGLFEPYIIRSYGDMDNYLRDAIIDNLVKYCNGMYDDDTIKLYVYTILYEAVCSSTKESITVFNNDILNLSEFLDLFDINFNTIIDENILENIMNVLKDIGVVVLVPNWRRRNQFRSYVVNPSITYQLIKCIYRLKDLPRYFLGYIFESVCMCHLFFNKNDGHSLFYLIGRRRSKNFEIDALIIDENRDHNKPLWLIECKLSDSTDLPEDASIVSDVVEELYADYSIQARFIVYNGIHCRSIVNNRDIVYDNLDNIIRMYKGLLTLDGLANYF